MHETCHTGSHPDHLVVWVVSVIDSGGIKVSELVSDSSLLQTRQCGLETQQQPRHNTGEDWSSRQSSQVTSIREIIKLRHQ